jgi:hypothetical protein
MITALAFFYAGRRVAESGYRRTAWWTAAILFVIVMVSLMLRINGVEGRWLDAAMSIGYITLGFLTSVIILYLCRDLLKLFRRAIPKRAPAFDPERRRFLIQSTHVGILATASAASGYGFIESHGRPRVEYVDIPLPDLPTAFDGFRIVQFTDLHVGPTIKRDFVESVAQIVQSLSGDMIVFTGDLVDGSVGWLRDDVAPIRDLSAPFGKYFITGNHEYYSGVMPWVREAERLGYDPLINAHRVIEKNHSRILLAGVTDVVGGGFDPSHVSDPHRAFDGALSGLVNILLAHQPKSIYDSEHLPIDLQISGHTHGGQFFPFNLLAAANQPYIKGLHRHGRTWVYVSRGTGYWGPPLRLGIPPEITVLRLVRTASA